MTTYYVDDGATGANNGGSGNDAWQSITDIAVPAGTHTLEFAEGSGPYFCDNWNMEQNTTTVNLNGCELTGAVNPNSATYQWNASGSGTNEYYLTLNGGGNPTLATVNCATIKGLFQEESAEDKPNHQLYNGTGGYNLGGMANHRLGWGDNDSLGYSTLYVRDDDQDPDSLDIKIAQVTEILDSNLRNTLITNGTMSYANARIANSRHSAGFTQTYRRIIFKYANDHAVEFTGQGDGRLEFCLGYFTGHRFVQDNDISDIYLLNCMSVYAHLFIIFGAASTAGTKTIENSLDWGSFAGSMDAGAIGYTLDENHNCWWPLLDQGTAMNYPDDTDTVWQTTDATSIPASADTGVTNRAALIAAGGQDPQAGSISRTSFNLNSFKLSSSTPAKLTIDWWTAAGAPNIGLDGVEVVVGGPVGPFGGYRSSGNTVGFYDAGLLASSLREPLLTPGSMRDASLTLSK